MSPHIAPSPPVYTFVIRIMSLSRFTDRYTSKLKITWQNIVDLIYLQFTIKIFHIFGFGTQVKPITINLNVKETKHRYQADKSKFYNPYISVACFLSSRTDLLCSPRIAAGEGLCLITHLVSYRGSKNCTQIKTKLHLQLGSLKEEFNPSWEYKPCKTIPVFYSSRCEDWTAVEDTSQESFEGSQLPILHMRCSYG